MKSEMVLNLVEARAGNRSRSASRMAGWTWQAIASAGSTPSALLSTVKRRSHFFTSSVEKGCSFSTGSWSSALVGDLGAVVAVADAGLV